MKAKDQRLSLLCLSFLLMCAVPPQNSGGQSQGQVSKLRTDEQNLAQTRAKLQEDIRNVESMDGANRPTHVVIMAGQHLLEGYALMTKEKYEGRIAAMVRLGEMTSQQAEQHKSDTLANTRAFPQAARNILSKIEPKLAVTKRELRALSSGSGEVANVTESPGRTTSRTNSAASNNLSGTWTADDGGTYVITQTGNRVVWEGKSGDGGRTWAHRFEGVIQGDKIAGRWEYLPTMNISGGGPLTVRIVSGSNLEKVSSSDDFGGAVWTRTRSGVTTSETGPAANTGEVENRGTTETRWGPINNQASLKGNTLTMHSVTTVEQCRADCDKNPQCVAFSVVRAEINYDKKPLCFLMSEVTGIEPSDCCISAIKRGSEPEDEPESTP